MASVKLARAIHTSAKRIGQLAVLSGCLLTVSNVRVASAQQTPASVVQGIVYYDINGNGQMDTGEVALANANVVTSIGGRGLNFTADATGHYQMALPPGEYWVLAFLGQFTNTGSAAPTAHVTLAAGQTLKLDLGILPPLSAVNFFPETGYSIDSRMREYFEGHGGVATFGYPISAGFRLLGFEVQMFQRYVLQALPDNSVPPAAMSVRPLNLMDPELFPVTTTNFSTFPAYSPEVANLAPASNAPDYAQAVLQDLKATVPDEFAAQPVHFLQDYLGAPVGSATYPSLATNLELLGLPTSRPAYDPNNAVAIYQRFQRGILQHDQINHVNRTILLAAVFRNLLAGDSVPSDVAAQFQSSRFIRQYCPGPPGWLCRLGELPATDLTFAFEPGHGFRR